MPAPSSAEEGPVSASQVPANGRDLADWLGKLFPEFRNGLETSPWIVAGRELTPHAVCMVFTHFYRRAMPGAGAAKLVALFRDIEAIMVADPAGHGAVGSAISTCFIENIADDAVGTASREYMGPETRAFFDSWRG